MYKVKHVSPSQIKTWRTCQRKWYLEKVKGHRQASTPAQQLGTDVHELLEHYVEYGKLLPDNFAGQIAKAALPMVNPDAKCEHQFTLNLVGDIVATGRIDFTNVGVIEDLKTTSSMRYAKTSEELKTDPQAVMYLWAAQNDDALAFFGPIHKFSHLIVETKAPHAIRRVDCTLTTDEIEQGMEDIKKDATSMKIAAATPLEDIGFNLDACRMYGGCHLHSICYHDGVFETPKGKDNEVSSLLERLRAEKRAQSEGKASYVPKGPAAPEPEPMPEETKPGAINPSDGIDLEFALPIPDGGLKKGKTQTLVPDWCVHAGSTIPSLKKAQAVEVWDALKATIYANPAGLDVKSMYGLLDWTHTGKMATEVKNQVKALIEAIPNDFSPARVEAPVTAPEPVAAPVTAPEPVAVAAPEPVAVAVTAPEPVAAPVTAPLLKQSGFDLSKGVLLVGSRLAFPSAAVHLDDLIQPLRLEVTKSDPDGRHWLLISDYGIGGSHRVAALLDHAIKAGSKLPAVVSADYRLPGHQECIAVLRPHYNVIEASI